MASPVKIAVRVKGARELMDKLTRYETYMPKRVGKVMKEFMMQVTKTAISYAPFRTGYLKSSISEKMVNELDYLVIAAARYAPYQEFGIGTGYVPGYWDKYALNFRRGRRTDHPPQRYLLRAFEDIYPLFEQKFNNAIRFGR